MKNRLLEEGTVRRFMKLANIDGLAGNFVNEGLYEDELDVPEEEEALPPGEGDPAPEDDLGGDLGGELDVPEEGGLEGDLGAEGGTEATIDVEGFMEDLADVLETHLDREVTTTVGDEAPLEEPMGLDPELPPAGEEDVEADLTAADVEVPEEEEEGAVMEEEDMINEVTKRVARRLLRMSAQNK